MPFGAWPKMEMREGSVCRLFDYLFLKVGVNEQGTLREYPGFWITLLQQKPSAGLQNSLLLGRKGVTE